MKKTLLFIATLLSALVASAKVINAVPAGDISWYLKQAEAGDVIEMADGTYDEAYAIKFSVENLTIKAAEGAKPVIALTGEWTSLKLAATTTFEGITFDGGGVAYYPIATEGENTCTFTFNNCEFKNYQYYAISNNNASTQTNVNSVVVNNCIFHDGGSAIYMNDQASCANLTVQNTTIYNFAGTDKYKAAIHIAEVASDATFATQTLIDHLTIYNYQNSSGAGAISIANASKTTISNSIIASPEQKWVASYNVATDANIGNCLVHNHHLKTEFASIITNADPMFVDAANANFQLYAESPAVGAGTAGSNLGDPRWGVKAGLKPGNGVLKKAVAAAAPGATIELGDGEYVETSSIDFNKEGLIIKAADGTKPVIKASSYLKHNATTTFSGITFDGQGTAEYTTYSYETGTEKDLTFINCEFKGYTKSCVTLGSAANVNQLTISGCTFDGGKATPAAINSSGIIATCQIENSEFKNYTEYCISASDYYRGRFDNLSINNCLLHDGTVAVYMPEYADAGDIQTCANFSLTNSTIYNMVCTKAVIDIRSNPDDAIEDLNKVVIDHITIYNYDATNGAIYIARTNDMSITNSIIATPEDKGQRALYVYGGTVDNTIHFNGSKRSGNTVYTKCENTDPMFVDADEANFKLYANSPAVGAGTDLSNLGDPRWGVSAKVLGKRIAVTPSDVASLPWMIQSDESNVKAGDTLVLADGTYTLSTIAFSKENLVVMAAENAKPVIANASEWACLELSASTTFDGITFDAGNVAHYIIASKGAASGKFAFVNCEFKGWTTWAISNQYEAGTHVDSVIVDNCLFHDGLGGAISFSGSAPEDQQSCQYFKMTNTTLYNLTESSYRGIINVGSNPEEEGKYNEVVIDHITMYNYELIESGIAAIAVRKSTDLKITNSIIANPEDKGYTALNVYGGTVDNTIHYNGSKRSGNTVYTKCENVDPLFVDAANGNFMLKYASPAVGAGTDMSNLGDPRWGVEAASVVEFGDADNSAAIAANAGNTMDVQINRSFTAVGEWYTICFPFSIPQEQQSKLGTIYTVGDLIAVANGEGVNISIQPISGPTTAYQAYLVKPSVATTNPVFEGVTIETGAPVTSSSTAGDYTMEFVGTINAGGQTDGSQYYIGDNGYLYNGVVDILGLRAFFTFTENGQPAKVRARVVAGTNATTGVDNVVVPEGQVLKVIENGQLIIIRGGEKFNVQGQKL